MNDLLQSLTKALRGTDGGSKAIAALVGVAVLIAVGITAFVAKTPHYDLLFERLNEQERAKAGKALAEAGIAFEASSSPGPYNIYVDESDRSRALAAAYQAGAFDKPLKGIVTNEGITAFMSASERDAHLEKALWQDMESMLETLDYVRGASVMRPKRRNSMLVSKGSEPRMASVTLDVSGGHELSHEQASTVARMVQTGLGVDAEYLTISDQLGNTVFDGSERLEDGLVDKELLEHQRDYDSKRSKKINEFLAQLLGPGKARVEITSEWDWEQSAEQTTEAIGDGIVLKSEKNERETPTPQRAGGPAGMTSNTASGDFGVEATGGSAGGSNSKSSDEVTTYAPTTKVSSRVRTQPQLERLSIVGVLDSSVVTLEDGTSSDARIADFEDMIKAAAGFVDARDTFHLSWRSSFFQPEVDENAADETEAAGPNPLMNMLLRRGVEIVTALVFVIFLLKSLKSSKADPKATGSTGPGGVAAAAAGGGKDDVNPELLARAQIEELLQSDPERVGSILASWAREDTAVAG